MGGGYNYVVINKKSDNTEYKLNMTLGSDGIAVDLCDYIRFGTIPQDPRSKKVMEDFTRLFGDRTLYRCDGHFIETIFYFNEDLGEGILEEEIEEFLEDHD